MEKREEINMLGIEKKIKEILYEYVKVESYSFSANEKKAEEFFLHHFSNIAYFKKNTKYYGSYPIIDDPFNRSACYAMVKGKGVNTIVLLHHYDVVTVEDFKLLKPYAFLPDELEEKLLYIKNSFGEEERLDLESKEWLYGRGVCDMKGGGAIQMALLEAYSELTDFKGNLIVLGVPDEENLSAGMRAAVRLLLELKQTHQLNYKLMINSEPHQRKNKNEGVFSFGSVGKVMPFIYARGCLAHAGKVFEGFNPVNVMSSIVKKTEVNMELSDTVSGEAAPPPTWLYLRDGKLGYDVSMPLTVKGCFNVITLNQTPLNVLEKVKNICENAFDEVLFDMNENYKQFLQATLQTIKQLPWKRKVVDFKTLYEEACETYQDTFREAYRNEIKELKMRLKENELSLLECNFQLVDFVYNYIDDLAPRVVYGLIPPYYPNVSNLFIKDIPATIKELGERLNQFTEDAFGQTYTKEYFYTGISDLSYTYIENSEEIITALEAGMPFFGSIYTVPLDIIEKIAMPCINIGPWGKDFHKLTERVLKKDLYERTPKIIKKAIEEVLGE